VNGGVIYKSEFEYGLTIDDLNYCFQDNGQGLKFNAEMDEKK
jgi:hypothetical protein